MQTYNFEGNHFCSGSTSPTLPICGGQGGDGGLCSPDVWGALSPPLIPI